MRPVVVNISTTQVGEGSRSARVRESVWEDDPFNDFGRAFRRSDASGPHAKKLLRVFIDADGSILTNNHVVENVRRSCETLDEQEYEAKVVGRDPKTDIAVIKINTKPA
jgi:S1-C subfamily serine protease